MPNNAINLQGRAAQLDVTGQQPTLFPFDAFEFDDANTVDNPVLSMKEPWTLEAQDLETLFANVGYTLTIGFEGTGTLENPDEGDRRIYMDGDEIIFQEYIGDAWSNNDALKLGGVDPNGNFNRVLFARGMTHTLNSTPVQEAYPGGDVWDFEDGLESNRGFTPNYDYVQRVLDAKFGDYGLEGTSASLLNASYLGFEDLVDFSFQDDFTVGFYVKLDTPAGGGSANMFIALKQDADTPADQGYWFLGMTALNKLELTYHLVDTTTDTVDTGLTIPSDGLWHYIGMQQQILDNGDTSLNVLLDTDIFEYEYVGILNADDFTNTTEQLSLAFPITTSLAFYTVDELFVYKGFLDLELLKEHYLKDVPWNSDFSQADLVFTPYEGGRTIIDSDLEVTGSIIGGSSGGGATKVTVSSITTLDLIDYTGDLDILADTSGGAFTLTLDNALSTDAKLSILVDDGGTNNELTLTYTGPGGAVSLPVITGDGNQTYSSDGASLLPIAGKFILWRGSHSVGILPLSTVLGNTGLSSFGTYRAAGRNSLGTQFYSNAMRYNGTETSYVAFEFTTTSLRFDQVTPGFSVFASYVYTEIIREL